MQSLADEREAANVLGFDIGGTNIRAVVADARGDFLAEVRVPSVKYSGQSDYADLFRGLRDDLLTQGRVGAESLMAVGVSVAGIVEPATNRIVMSPNISDLPEFDLRSILESGLGLPVLVDNDANLAAMGEHRRGVARGYENFVFVAVGTGIGAGIFINGRLYRGAHNSAGMVGHLYVHGLELIGDDGLGVLERRASGPAIALSARERLALGDLPSLLAQLDPERLTSEDVWAAASMGDALAGEVLNEALDTLALGLANAALLLDPELIVLGGGVSRAGDALLRPLRQRLGTLLPRPVAPRLELSLLGPNAQLHGAVGVALDSVYFV